MVHRNRYTLKTIKNTNMACKNSTSAFSDRVAALNVTAVDRNHCCCMPLPVVASTAAKELDVFCIWLRKSQ